MCIFARNLIYFAGLFDTGFYLGFSLAPGYCWASFL